MHRYPLLLVLVFPAACALMGGPSLIDDAVVQSAAPLGDADLMADVEALHGVRFAPGSGEQFAALCLQQYVRGRKAEAELSRISDDYGRRVAQSEMMQGYGTCAAQCKIATEQAPSKYSPIAAKYTARCEAGASSSEASLSTDALERLAASYRSGTQPLELYFADRDATASIEYLRKEGLANEKVEALAKEVQALGEQHADAIAKGRSFFESGPAQENFRLRSANEAQQRAIEGSMKRLEAEHDEAVAAGLAARATNLQLEHAAQRDSLAQTVAEHAALKAQYETMAEDAGVFTRK